jgi:hypothetical protein
MRPSQLALITDVTYVIVEILQDAFDLIWATQSPAQYHFPIMVEDYPLRIA